MGWTFVRLTRDQLIRELTATEETERSRSEVIDHTLVGNVLWTVARVTAKQAGVLGLAPGESATLIGCHLLESEGREWGYKFWSRPSTRTTTRARCAISTWRRSAAPPGAQGCMPSTSSRRAKRPAMQPPTEANMDTLMSSLPPELLRFVEDQLANNEVSDDDELREHFIANGLSEEQAWQALTYRALYLRHVFLDGFTPILKGQEALCFNPHSRGWEPVPNP